MPPEERFDTRSQLGCLSWQLVEDCGGAFDDGAHFIGVDDPCLEEQFCLETHQRGRNLVLDREDQVDVQLVTHAGQRRHSGYAAAAIELISPTQRSQTCSHDEDRRRACPQQKRRVTPPSRPGRLGLLTRPTRVREEPTRLRRARGERRQTWSRPPTSPASAPCACRPYGRRQWQCARPPAW